jgi:molecular chaperone DnaK (HSP70)
MWSLDLGTTNSLLARWDATADRPVVLELPALARQPVQPGNEAARAVPSAVHVLEDRSFWARLGTSRLLARHLFLGKLAHVGRPALELNRLRHRPSFVPSFKRQLSRSPLLTVARAGDRGYSAREVAYLFLRELLAEAKRVTGKRIRDLVVTSPIDAYETYRAEVSAICSRLGVRRVRFLDEPVAAAVGYGLGLSRSRQVLVVDFGGGTLHFALLRVGAGEAAAGQGEVLAKAARDVGGNLVDLWVLEELCRRLHLDLDGEASEEERLWQGLLLAEACRAKETIYFTDQVTFEVLPPENLRRFEARLRGEAGTLAMTRQDLVRLLEERGLYQTLQDGVDEVLEQARRQGVSESQIDDVLMVGGSTLLPEVYPLFERRFGRGRVRAWQPFEAVAQGAAVYAAGRVAPADFIVHDYALLTHELHSQKPQYTVVVPRGTRFPTAPDFWKRQLVPTCALGEPERVFKLIICEIGSRQAGELAWDADGRLRRVHSEDDRVVVKLNERNPALGQLDPPHPPRDRSPRLEISLGVNADRWLCATVRDLRTRKVLMSSEPVVRLL